ncbi:hypothetical protein Cfor_00480, partial [Coptotermes formosanus]
MISYSKRLTLSGQFERMEWNGKTIHEFLEQSEQFGKICQWMDSNLVKITTLLKLSGKASFFVRGPSSTASILVYPAACGKTEKSECPKQFLDRCWVLRSKTFKASCDPDEQRILGEEAGR